MNIEVVGADGVIGVSTAMDLQTEIPNYRETIVAHQLTNETKSDLTEYGEIILGPKEVTSNRYSQL